MAACSRAETKQEAQQVADSARTVAARAGDKFADSWLTTKVQAKYFADRTIKARYINVDTRDGVVTLSGFVERPEQRTHAEQIARSTDGVRSVVDQLLVGHAPPGYSAAAPSSAVATTGSGDNPGAGTTPPPDDATITSSIQAKYFVEPSIKARQVDVDVRGGVVTLRGEVASEAERGQALTLARTTPGVQRVEDTLTINPAVTSAEGPATGSAATAAPAVHLDDAAVIIGVKTRLASANASQVEVSSRNGVVVLQGTVANADTRNRIIDTVRQSEGVVQVVDRLGVAPRK
jgi:hyperosmotically inducible protein